VEKSFLAYDDDQVPSVPHFFATYCNDSAPLKEINDTLRDFRQWPKWSPWLIMEPDAVLTYTDRQGQVGATYAWAGHLVGAGSMELVEVHDDSLKMELNFYRPFRSCKQ